jgi:signal transduction histidine kinase
MSHHLGRAKKLVRDSLKEARNSIWQMRSQVLETGSLVSALKNILEQMSANIVLVTHFEAVGEERRFSPIIEDNILRLGQEAITNAVKHARARKISVTMDFGKNYYSLTVTDDGRGFDPANPPPSEGGFGLVGMQERADELKGKLKVRTAPNQGTEINFWIPLSDE